MAEGVHPEDDGVLLNASEAPSAGRNECFYGSDNLETKFFLLTVFGPFICLVGVIGNFLATIVFLRKRMRSIQHAFLAAMALCDIGVLMCFFFIYTIENISDYYKIFDLYEVWIYYGRELFFLAHLFKAAAVYLTLSASVERWLATACSNMAGKLCKSSWALTYISLVVFFSFTLCATKYLEISLIETNCTGFAKYRFEESALFKNPTYKVVYSLYLAPLFITWLPFMLLLFLNIATAYSFQRQNFYQMFGVDYHFVNIMTRIAYLRSEEGRRLREKKRETTIVIIIIVGAFLICNTPDFCITLIEHIDIAWLMKYKDFYSFAKDAVNILAIIQSSINFFIYIIFGSEFRFELATVLGCSKYQALGQQASDTKIVNGAGNAENRTPELSEIEYLPRVVTTTV